jgi:hypothetical protein
MELAKKVLGDYGGIWAMASMASRILLVLGAGVLTYLILSARSRWSLITLNTDRAVELVIATLIVAMLLLVRLPWPDEPSATHASHRFLSLFLLFRY